MSSHGDSARGATSEPKSTEGAIIHSLDGGLPRSVPSSLYSLHSSTVPTKPSYSLQLSDPNVSSAPGIQEIRPHAIWSRAGRETVVSFSSFFTVLTIASALILSIFSKSGVLTFQGQIVKWKLLLFTLQLEIAIVVVIEDILALGIDYFLVNHGITLDQLSHAMSHMVSFHKLSGAAYKSFYMVIILFGYVVAPFFLSVVLVEQDPTTNRFVQIENTRIETNTIGGRLGENYGATGQSYLFNASAEKFEISDEPWHYVIYQKAGLTRSVFIPKTPQIGPYSRECNSDMNENIVAARILAVQGLLYHCEPTVEEVPQPIRDFNSTVPPGTSNDTMRLIQDDHAGNPSGTKGTFRVSIAVKKAEGSSTSILRIPCDVTAARGNIAVEMNIDGIMTMSLEEEDLTELDLILPRRVIGTDSNELNFALENSIGRKGIGIVSVYASSGRDINVWDGLIRAIVGAYGIRSALRTTFADAQDTRAAVNVRELRQVDEVQLLRVWVLWIPTILAVITRLLYWRYLSIFTGGIRQVMCWLGVDNQDAGGELYREKHAEKSVEAELNLNFNPVQGGRSILWLGLERDLKLGLGSFRGIRRQTGYGLVAGPVEASSTESRIFRGQTWKESVSLHPDETVEGHGAHHVCESSELTHEDGESTTFDARS